MTSTLEKHFSESRYSALLQNIRAIHTGASAALAQFRQHKAFRHMTFPVLMSVFVTIIAFDFMLRGEAQAWFVGISTIIYTVINAIAPASVEEDRGLVANDKVGPSRYNYYEDSETTNAFDDGIFSFIRSNDDQSSSDYQTDSSPMFSVNPATGLPMIDDVIDAGGNVFESSDWDSSSDCSLGFDSSFGSSSFDDSSAFGSSWED